MTITLQIIRDGITEDSHTLDPGQYSIGRADDRDIVLSHGSVSKRHASLTVTSKQFKIKDEGSVNGLYINGKRIKAKALKHDADVELGAFLLRFSIGRQKTKTARGSDANRIGPFARVPLKVLVFCTFWAIMWITFAIVYLPTDTQIGAFKEAETIKRGILLGRYLAEINRDHLARGQIDQIRLHPVSKEDGVVRAYVVDGAGAILAPPKDTGRFVKWSRLSQVLSDGKLAVESIAVGEKRIYYPISQMNQTIGVALLQFNTRHALSKQGPRLGPLAYALLLLLTLFCLLMTRVVLKVFFRPLHQLEEKVELALKRDASQIDFTPPNSEVDRLAQLFNRLLIRTPRAADSGTEPPAQTATQPPSNPPSAPPPAKRDQPAQSPSAIERDDDIWCTIDCGQYVIVAFSGGFKRMFGEEKIQRGMHVLEAFEDPEVLTAVSGCIENPAADQPVNCAGQRPLQIVPKPETGGSQQLTLKFEEI